MAKTLTDLSQLTKAILKESPPSRVEPAPAAQPAPTVSDEDREAEEVLAYFSRTPQKASRSPRVAPRGVAVADRPVAPEAALEAKAAALDALAEEKAAADERIAELERRLAAERDAREAAARERDRLQGECGRLQGELRKTADKGAVAAPAQPAPVAQAEPQKPTRALLAANGAIAEAFPGEVREQVLAALADALAAAQQSGRERRAEILRYVLAANQSSGELERRRAELKQILKDAGSFTDASTLAALGRIGIRCISGRKHWKLEYADIRMPMSKTPSDYRSAQNCASDMANRCF